MLIATVPAVATEAATMAVRALWRLLLSAVCGLDPMFASLKRLAVRPTACPNRGLRRIGRRRASDMGDGPDERHHLRGFGCP